MPRRRRTGTLGEYPDGTFQERLLRPTDVLMFDAWRSWGRDYTRDMLDRLAPLDPRWLEQPFDKQRVDGYATLVREAPFPIAGGEHGTTRWDSARLIEARALDVLQPEPFYTGGITETDRVCTLGSTHGVTVVPHGNSVPAIVQLVAAQPPSVCPYVEFLIQRNATNQFFSKRLCGPRTGTLPSPTDQASAPPSTTRSSSPRPNWRDRSGVQWSPWGFIQPAVAACRQFAGQSGAVRN